MKNCEFCCEAFEPTKPVRTEQRFCSSECRKRWHYREAKHAGYAAAVETAERRMNDHITSGKRIDLAAIGLAPAGGTNQTVSRRRNDHG